MQRRIRRKRFTPFRYWIHRIIFLALILSGMYLFYFMSWTLWLISKGLI